MYYNYHSSLLSGHLWFEIFAENEFGALQSFQKATGSNNFEYTECAQSLYAMKVLRCHGMREDALKIIFMSVGVAKILYASPASRGFATISDKQRLESFVSRAVRLGLC